MAELAAALLVLLPATVPYGAALALLLMGGAIMSHLTKLGIVVMDDGGLLFGLAVSVAAVSAALVWIHRHRLPLVGDRA